MIDRFRRPTFTLNQPRRIMCAICALFVGLFIGQTDAHADGIEESSEAPTSTPNAVTQSIEFIIAGQEGTDTREWPYEGVYRQRGKIPIGYRVGGTSLCGLALIESPGFKSNDDASQAVRRAVTFVCSAIEHPRMSHNVKSTYDVRGWGYTYGLTFLLKLQKLDLVPLDMIDAVHDAAVFYAAGIAATEIPEQGGWNYARRGGFDKPGRPSPFMTAPTLQALFAAIEQGHDIDRAMIHRGLAALIRARTPAGGYQYAGTGGKNSKQPVPGSIGRMLVSEATLFLAGESDPLHVRAAVDSFFVHWKWLEARRAKTGTHVAPYGVAPYYFFFAHYYAAQAIELLPAQERAAYRERLRELLFQVRNESGEWNDRVFPRSANYGTAMAVMALMMPEMDRPTRLEHAVE